MLSCCATSQLCPQLAKPGGKFAKCHKYQIFSVAANRFHITLLFMMLYGVWGWNIHIHIHIFLTLQHKEGFKDDPITLRQPTCSRFPCTTLLWALESSLKSQGGQSSSAHQMPHLLNFEAACAWQGSLYQARVKVRFGILPFSFRAWRSVFLISSWHLQVIHSLPLLYISQSFHKRNKKKENIYRFANNAKQARLEWPFHHFFPPAMGTSCHTGTGNGH